MRMRTVAALALVLLAAGPVAAQNLCDATPATNPQLNTPFAFEFGWDGKDDAGIEVIDPASVQVEIIKDGVAQPLVPLPAPIGTPTVSGCQWYRIANQVGSKASHTITGRLVTADGASVPPSPFAFTVVGRVPSAMVKPQARP